MQCNAKQCNNITNNASQVGPKLVRQCPYRHKMALSWPQVGARMTQLVLKAARLRAYSCTVSCLHPPWVPKWIQDIRNSRQDGTKNAQVGPKLVENGPKMAPFGLISGPNFAKFDAKLIQGGFKWIPKLHEGLFSKTCTKNNDKQWFSLCFVLNFGLRCRTLQPKWCYIGRNWPQVGTSWTQIGPRVGSKSEKIRTERTKEW